MEQIGGVNRRLEWKEKYDDVPTLCDVDVFFAVDYCSQEAGFRGHFHGESSVWLDGGRMGDRADLGLRGRDSAARFRDGWPGTVLHPVRCDDHGCSFLPELRQAAVSRTASKSASETQPSPVIRAIRAFLSNLPSPSIFPVMRATAEVG